MRYRSETIPAGDAGLDVKLRRLRQLVAGAARDPRFRLRALQVLADARVPERDYDGELHAVSRFVRRLRYQHDPAAAELFTDPRVLASAIDGGDASAAGDCDDFVALGAALLEALGRRTRFVVGGDGGAAWRHIWLEALHPERGWTALDDTVRARRPGWSPASAFPALATELAGSDDRGMVARRHQPRPIMVRTFYGGASGLQGLDGFSLKKIAKKITRPIEKAVSRVVPKDVKKIVGAIAKPVQQTWKALGKGVTQASGLYKQVLRPLAPFQSAVANVLVPGSGIVVDQLTRTRQPRISNAPNGAFDLPSVPQVQASIDRGAGADSYGGGSGASSFAPYTQPRESTTPAWLPWAIGGTAVVAGLVLLSRRRR